MRPIRTALAVVWAFLSLVVMLPIGLLVMPFDPSRRVYGFGCVLWARGILALCGCRIEVEGLERLDPDARYVVVCNHQSALDPVVLVAALHPHLPIRFVAKRSLFRIPILGWGMRMTEHVPLDRSSMRQAMGALEQARSEIARFSMVLFPEGTRTVDGRLGEFRPGAFAVAVRAGVPILPVAISGAFEVLPTGANVARTPATIRVIVGERLGLPPGQDLDAVRETARTARAAITELLGPGEDAP